MSFAGGRIQLRGWYVALVAVWAITGLPLVVILGVGFAGFIGFLAWLALNAAIFAPVMLAPYGVSIAPAERLP